MTDKITLGNLVNLTNQTAAITTINNNNALLTTAINNTLSRDGTPPNQMTAALDMNSNRILNLPAPISNSEPLRFIDGVTAGLQGPIGPQGIQGPAGTNGTNGTGLVNAISAGNAGITIAGTSTNPTVSNAGVLSVTAGTGITVTGTASAPIVSTSSTAVRVSGDNLLPNCNWQLHSKVSGASSTVSRTNVAGTGLSSQIAVTGFTPNSQVPTCTTANTQDLVNGDLVVFGPTHAGLSGYALRAFNVIPNTSFQVTVPFSYLTPGSSSAQTAFPCGITDTNANGFAPDGGWQRSASTFAMWIDDWTANACPGAKRVLGLRKAAGTNEALFWRPRTDANLVALRGQTVTLGILIRQKVGTGPSIIYINDGTTVTNSTSLTGQSYVNAATNNYQLLTVTATISSTTNFLEIGFVFSGSTNDICYVAIPTLKIGTLMLQSDLGQPFQEVVVADTHWNPPILTPFAGVTWPGGQIVPSSGLYGWTDIDLEAISYGQVHNSIRKANAKIEFVGNTVGMLCFVGYLDIAAVQLTFGLQCVIAAAGITNCTNMSWVPLARGNSTTNTPSGCFCMFSATPSGGFTNITFDFDDVMA